MLNSTSTQSSCMGNRRVFITGGSGGIGNGIIRCLVNNGASVIVGCNRNCERVKQISKELPGTVGSIEQFRLNLLDVEEISRIELPIADALIHCAGLPSFVPLSECSVEELQKQYQIHVLGPLLLTQRFLVQSYTKLRDVIFISSTAGIELPAHSGAYALSKSGTIAMSKLLAKELRSRDIRVNTIAPGWCETSMAERVLNSRRSNLSELKSTRIDGTLVSIDEIGRLCIDLLSNRLPHLQGQVIVLESLSK